MPVSFLLIGTYNLYQLVVLVCTLLCRQSMLVFALCAHRGGLQDMIMHIESTPCPLYWPVLKGIAPQKKFYRLNLIFWDLKGQRRGAAPMKPLRRPSRSLGTKFETKIFKFRWFLGPSDQKQPIPHPITIQNMRFRRQKIYYGTIPSNYITYYYIILYDIIQYLQYSIQVAPA